LGIVSAIDCTVTGRNGRPMLGNLLVDPNLVTLPILYKNAVTGETSRFSIGQLSLGVKCVSVGSFYFVYHPLMYYYCDAIQGDEVRWHLIESFQHGEIIRATFTQQVKDCTYFIAVSDREILNRLRGRLDEYLQLSSKKV
jgi:hypothetical protein